MARAFRSSLGAGLGVSLAMLAACSGSNVAREPTRLRVTYGARASLHDGLSAEQHSRPARSVRVDFLGQEDEFLATAFTDADGGVVFPAGTARIRVMARIERDGVDLATTEDGLGRKVHRAVIGLDALSRAADGSRAVHFDDAASGMAGALHIADTLLAGSEALTAWGQRPLPPFFTYWGRGITTEWSFFRGEVPPGSGRHSLELLGGPLGEQARTDTDEHDDGIILHELGHYVMNQLAGDSSIAGRHPPGSLVDPGVAWEEGRATWFAMAVLARVEPGREAMYRDTVGIVPTGSTRIDEDVEHPSVPRGVGSERSVAGVLWDLTDGVEGIPDRDDDGVALGPARVLRAMHDFSLEPGAFACVSSFLDFLVRTDVASTEALTRMLERSGEPATLLAPEAIAWPSTLTFDAPTAGALDGLTDPAPSGGPARPENGVDAVRAFRFALSSRTPLRLVLTIDGGEPANDLALELRTTRAELLQRVAPGPSTVTLDADLDAGHYIVLVRDGGRGNRAAFTLALTRRAP